MLGDMFGGVDDSAVQLLKFLFRSGRLMGQEGARKKVDSNFTEFGVVDRPFREGGRGAGGFGKLQRNRKMIGPFVFKNLTHNLPVVKKGGVTIRISSVQPTSVTSMHVGHIRLEDFIGIFGKMVLPGRLGVGVLDRGLLVLDKVKLIPLPFDEVKVTYEKSKRVGSVVVFQGDNFRGSLMREEASGEVNTIHVDLDEINGDSKFGDLAFGNFRKVNVSEFGKFGRKVGDGNPRTFVIKRIGGYGYSSF